MAKYVIEGGKKLYGKVNIESAKNAVLPIIAGAVLFEEPVIIEKCPKIDDVLNMIKIIESLGVKTYFRNDDLVIDASCLSSSNILEDLSKKLRSSFFLLGSLLSRNKKATVSYPGGCKIGKRPIDIHIESFKSLGVKIVEGEENIECSLEKLSDKNVILKYPSVGATENLILLLAISNVDVKIYNVAKEPEIEDLANFLNSAGAKIYGVGTDVIRIVGVKKLKGISYKPIFDRIEAGTYMIATAITGGEVEISNVNPKKIQALLNKFYNNTCKIGIKDDIITISSEKRLHGFFVETNPYPYFPTDLQAQIAVLGAVSDGYSKIKENVFESRFEYVKELVKMGANVKIKENLLEIKGKKLLGAEVKATDLRGGAALTLAGLVAEGETVVLDVFHIERGYVNFNGKLKNLGANIERVE
ncbi:MAG: UDP-N-acetylglucosamine 1-carboxyvinyltransferase [Clostridiales bacterium]|nr:UDP-N-acetylglucosamine 1-carboxyvinyltransferase [Clostridiales bacterium]